MSRSVRVKICGLVRAEDARRALDLGADFLGFVFVPGTPRALEPMQGARLLAELDTGAARRVGVFRDQPAAFVNEVARGCGLDLVQLHDRTARADTAAIALPVIRVLRVPVPASGVPAPEEPMPFDERTFALLIDAADERGQSGGLGLRPDPVRIESALRRLPAEARVILSGGLRPENVAEAVGRHRPYAVDVSSGVESSPGVKDPGRLRDFFAALEDPS